MRKNLVGSMQSRHAERRGITLNSKALGVIGDLLRLFDAVVIFAFGYVFYRFYAHIYRPDFWPDYASITAIGMVVGAIVLTRMDCYKSQSLPRTRQITRQVTEAVAVTFAIVLALVFLTRALGVTSRVWFCLWVASSAVTIISSRVVVSMTLKTWSRMGVLTERVAIVGAGALGRRVLERIKSHPWASVDIVGVFDDRLGRANELELNVDGTIAELAERAARMELDKIVVALPLSAEHRLLAIINKLRVLPVDIVLFPDSVGFRLNCRDVDHVAELPMMRVHERTIAAWTYVAKQIEDKVLGMVLLASTAPLMALIALLIKLDSAGPVFFTQKRHGFNNLEIEVLKFRTMYIERSDAAGARQTARDDPRVTRIGRYLRRFSLDELPQIINVIKGEMSVVGPRPLPIGMKTENLSCQEIVEHYAGRHRMKPGITGWAQVRGLRGAATTTRELEARIAHDLFYIDNWSIGFDLYILMITVPKVLIFNKDAF